jgi:hypothetical protein
MSMLTGEVCSVEANPGMQTRGLSVGPWFAGMPEYRPLRA